MAFITYPLNNIDYTAEDAELFHCTRTSGIWAKDSFPISVTGADNNVTIGTGIAWINNEEFSGKVAALKSAEVLDLGIADGTYPRIDVIAIQFNTNNNATDVVIKKGTPATNPVRPSIVRTGAIYELYLASVYRPAGATAVTASNITDLRMDGTVCGLMADSVTKVDMDAIRAQLTGLVEELEEAIQNIEVGEVVPIEKGGTNAQTSAEARQNINFIGVNPIASVNKDTTANWVALGTGVCSYNIDAIRDQPTQYGTIISTVAVDAVTQIWLSAGTDGGMYYRRGNSAGWQISWTRVLDKNNGTQIKTLWTNASPSSEFAAQTINIGTPSDYDFVIVSFATTTVIIGWYTYIAATVVSGASYGTTAYKTRMVNFNPNGVVFQDAYRKTNIGSTTAGSTSNADLIPRIIYGIKGVQ